MSYMAHRSKVGHLVYIVCIEIYVLYGYLGKVGLGRCIGKLLYIASCWSLDCCPMHPCSLAVHGYMLSKWVFTPGVL